MTRRLEIPELSLVVLVGASGSGKSTFARTHFLPTEVVSSDFCRGLVSDDENAQDATGDAFELLHYIAGKRMTRGRLTVVDATNVQPEARTPLVSLAREHTFSRSRSSSTCPSASARTATATGPTVTSVRS
jgi:predicted kinase